MRQISGSKEYCIAMLSNTPLTDRAMYSTNGTPYLFPLYIYEEKNNDLIDDFETKKSNLNIEIVKKIEMIVLNLQHKERLKPEDILYYIYAVLYSNKYRNKYKEFIKIDFPRIPYPKNTHVFMELVKLGSQLKKLHLMEDASLKLITQYPESGNNIVEKPIYKDGNVYINDEQYFENVPERAWNFFIGGYQPAQKWLKDRKDQALQFEDIKHYQKIIATLQRTSEIMKAIDEIDFL